MIAQTKHKTKNSESLTNYKKYFYSNRSKISYKSYKMINGVCVKILNDFLTSRELSLLIDLKEHTMFIGELYKQIKENFKDEEYLTEIKDKFQYYKEWILDQSDMKV